VTQLKLRKIGTSLSTSRTKELLSRLNVKEGDRLFVVEIPHGVMVTPMIRSSSAPFRMPTK
jgi:putative addiction module antidote